MTAKKKKAKKTRGSKPDVQLLLNKRLDAQADLIFKLQERVRELENRIAAVEARPGYIPPPHPTYPPPNPIPWYREVWCKAPRGEMHCIYSTDTEAGR